MSDLQIQIINASVGFLTPFLISGIRYFVEKGMSKPWIYTITLVISLLIGFISALSQGVQFNDVSTIVCSMAVAFTATNVTYTYILKGLGIDAAIKGKVLGLK